MLYNVYQYKNTLVVEDKDGLLYTLSKAKTGEINEETLRFLNTIILEEEKELQ